MTITDRFLAGLCQRIYQGDHSDNLHFDPGTDGDHICWCIQQVDGINIVVFRGSVTFVDWVRDLMALANPFHHDDLGPVHPGFLSGIRTVQRELRTIAPDGPVIVTGHSLGAGRAAVLAGMLTLEGRTPVARVVFGEPVPGFRPLAELTASVPTRSYCNGDEHGHDRVTDVPFRLPPLLLYQRQTALTRISVPPPASIENTLGIFAYHHIEMYSHGCPDVVTL